MENAYNSTEIIRIARNFSKTEIKDFFTKRELLDIHSPREMNIIIDFIACLHFFDCLIFENDIDIAISFVNNFKNKHKTIVLSYDNLTNKEGYTIYKNHIHLISEYCQNNKNINEEIANIVTSFSIHEVRHRVQKIYNFNDKSCFYEEEVLLKAINSTSLINNNYIKNCKIEKETINCINYLNDKFEEDAILIENMFLCKIEKEIKIEDIKEILISKSLIL